MSRLASQYPPEVQQLIKRKIEEIDALAEDIPGVIIIHELKDFSVLYMSPRGLRELGIALNDVEGKLPEEYHAEHFNPDDARDYTDKVLDFIRKGEKGECVSFFQQVRIAKGANWVWHMSSLQVLLWSPENQPLLTITISFPVDPSQHVTNKVSRLLEENNFLRKHYDRFASLGKRERDVLRLTALGKSSAEISAALFISPATVETHRKNIRQKLNAASSFELAQYARAFDLI